MYRFIDMLDHFGYPGDARLVYKYLDYENHGHITLKELDTVTQDPVFREHAGDHSHQRVEAHHDKPKTAVEDWGKLGSPTKKPLPGTRSAEATAQNRRTLQGFRHILEQKYGNLVRAWKALGAHPRDHMKYDHFTEGLQRDGFRGRTERHGDLWHELRGFQYEMYHHEVTLEMFAPETWKTLTEFVLFLEKKYGDLTHAWGEICEGFTDKHGRGKKVGKYTFCSALERMGYEGNSHVIFGWLDVDQNNHLTAEWIQHMPSGKSIKEREEKRKQHMKLHKDV